MRLFVAKIDKQFYLILNKRRGGDNLADFSGIYMIQNYITKKVYIGQSVHVYERIYKHLWELKNNKHRNKDQQIPVLFIEPDVIYPSMHDAARALNMSPGHIPDCCKGKRNTAGGYHWAYVLKEEGTDIR